MGNRVMHQFMNECMNGRMDEVNPARRAGMVEGEENGGNFDRGLSVFFFSCSKSLQSSKVTQTFPQRDLEV